MSKFVSWRIALAAAAILGLAACGGASSPTPSTAPSTDVLAEIQFTIDGLDQALAALEAGDAVKAEQLAGDAYLEHFEYVEGPLEARNAELTKTLEDLIRDELRNAIKAGKSVAEVTVLVDQAKAGLERAAALLR
ncbi:MAG: hypothetical protein V4515_04400 [Chloroflexota bacterium]